MKFSRRTFLAAGAAVAVGCQVGRREEVLPRADEDGSELWLRYRPLGRAGEAYRFGAVRVEMESATGAVIRKEIDDAFQGMLGPGPRSGQLVIGNAISPAISRLPLAGELADLGPQGYLIRTMAGGNDPTTVIAANSEIGALYGTFHLLRLMQSLQPMDRLAIVQKPRLSLRLLNHWDNIDGSIERGYAGRSLWNWAELPGVLSPRYEVYARANASIGINGTVLNNVNANARFLSAEYLAKVKALADLWRPYGLRVYLSANFASPVSLERLANADPLNPAVADWWKRKADEIYAAIPDFGGLLVKANSEGQPGPQDYGRNHAEGANMLADAFAPHKGHIIWRAFIYNQDVDPDRAKRAYIEFMALEGKFRPNVLVQVKNGPIDFQPREPFHPLFGAMKQTPVLAELQPTQEYLGQAKHLVYLGTMWKEFLESDTHAAGAGSTVGKVLEGKVHPQSVTGMAGVLNTGTDVNWCGHDFSQANWYAYGRLCWDHELGAEAIAREWARMTWTNDDADVKEITGMMMGSWESFVRYTMPLGLHHLIGGDHYAPMPWNAAAQRADWTAAYYHQANAQGIGFDRTIRGGRAVEQYFPPVRELFDDRAKCPEKFLLWFHRLGWTEKLRSGRTLWEEICAAYRQGAEEASALQTRWIALAGKVDGARHRAVAARLAVQATDAAKWRDACLAYFSRISGMPLAD